MISHKRYGWESRSRILASTLSRSTKPELGGGDSSLTVDQKGIWHVLDAVCFGGRVVVENDLVGHSCFFDKWSYYFPTIRIQGNTDHDEAFRGVLAIELGEPRYLFQASVAPRGPEIEKNDFPAIVPQIYGFAGTVSQRKLGCGLASVCGLHGGANGCFINCRGEAGQRQE